MTEADWLACTDPTAMLQFLQGKVNPRKLRLFVCAYCRRVWHLLIDERSRKAVETAERFADGLVADSEREEALSSAAKATRAVHRSPDASPETILRLRRQHQPGKLFQAAVMAAFAVGQAGEAQAVIRAVEDNLVDRVMQSRLLCDILGNLFRPVVLHATWQTPTTIALARTIYEDRTFGDLPVLADALEDAGCRDAALLDHCREPGPHVRGCWVLDLLTGKE